ncbi:uncharacterized protein LOC125022801 [Mugil cephalus]|uniref:uncharacterized protein LOC125022801 n=1 Tax=Mugil cephalus TaxID=48193 RepID=UPI001FB77B52|nr:uncharacterized protein LOC125022801 [Mugil cephalus]
MEKAAVRELNAVLVGSRSAQKYHAGNIILGKEMFDPGEETCCCERGEAEVCGRIVSLIKAPGWLRGYCLCDTSELYKTEAILSVTMCPPKLHGFILVINAEMLFKDVNKKATLEHMQHFFGESVWDHTIVVFIHRGRLGKTIEQYIKGEGAPLQSLLEACGKRYHSLCDEGKDNDMMVKELFEKIDAMVAANSYYEMDSTLVQSAEARRTEVNKKAEDRCLQSHQQRETLKALLTEPKPSLRILMVGWVFSGKSAAGNIITRSDVFPSGERTVKTLKQRCEVAGRDVFIVDTPGWWKFFPPVFNPPSLKSEMLEGVSLCSPSPDVILLAVTLDTSFTEEQRRITESNMRLLGQRVWRHVIVLFTLGDTLGDKTVEQYIEGEGKPLQWLIEKCGNRYHVFNKKREDDDDQVIKLLEKMEEMVAGNYFFYLSANPEDPQPEQDRSDELSETRDENTTKEVTEQLTIEWDRRYWEKHHILKGNNSMDSRPNMSESMKSGNSEKDEKEINYQYEDDEFQKRATEDEVGASNDNPYIRLLEREWSRREAVMEQAGWIHFFSAENMEKATAVRELNAVLVGSRSAQKYYVGNMILGKETFDPGEETCCCERGEAEVCGRRVSLIKAPGWLRGYCLCDTSELYKTEAILSVTMCPPQLHCFILVINAEILFKVVNKKATLEHMQHFFGETVWDHTIVVVIHRGHLGKTIEQYIKGEGAPLQSLLEACGNRYHSLCDEGKDNDTMVKELFEKIDAMVAANSYYDMDSTLVQSTEARRTEVNKKAEDRRLQSHQRRETLKALLTEPKPSLRILVVGWVFSGKSAAGNIIMRSDVFHSGERTVKASKQHCEVAGRDVVIVDTPGWWKFFPPAFNPPSLKSEILEGVSLCSPSPNVILLAVTLDTSFTEEQRRITESNMRLFGHRVWRHVIVLFTLGDTLGDKTVEQYIEGEGKPLQWLIEKCGNRYHVFNKKRKDDDDQVIKLMEKMEEMVAGNYFFYFSANPDDPQPEQERSDELSETRDENTTKEVTEQLTIEWDRRNWEKHHILKGNNSMDSRPNMSDSMKSGNSEKDEKEINYQYEDDEFQKRATEDEVGASNENPYMRLLEREWSRREAVMEQAGWTLFFTAEKSEPDVDQVLESRAKVSAWLKQLDSGCGDTIYSVGPEEEAAQQH